jgi:5-methylcytosine-specific restriction enzyme subunit McrC
VNTLPVVKEHGLLDTGDLEIQDQLEALARKTKKPGTEDRVLGLHLRLIPGERRPAVSVWWFVGQVWVSLGDKPPQVLRVRPKVDNVAPVQMYAECVTHPVVRPHLDDCMYFYWDQRPIPVEDRDHPITPLVVMRFLCLLHELCQKHLRLMITPVEANLAGRIKGKPLVQPTLRMNHARGRLDRTHCRYQVQSIDTVPNQILVAALHQAIRYLYQSPLQDQRLSHLATFSANALSGVTLRRILPTDFQGLQYGGFLRPYREPHRWARLVLRLLGPDPLEEIAGVRETALPPFAIDMSKLFERYCETKLRRVSSHRVWAGYKDCNLGLPPLQVRPDFLVHSGDARWVVDAKYTDNWSWNNEDVYQVIAYSAHKDVTRVLSELGPGSDSDHRPTAVILYPALPGDQVSDQARGLNLRAALRDGNVLQDFEFDILRIPVILPSLSSSRLQDEA